VGGGKYFSRKKGEIMFEFVRMMDDLMLYVVRDDNEDDIENNNCGLNPMCFF